MTPDVHVRVRRLVVPASDEGDGIVRARDVIEAIERHLGAEQRDAKAGIDPATGSTVSRIGEAVAHSVRATLAAQSRSVP